MAAKRKPAGKKGGAGKKSGAGKKDAQTLAAGPAPIPDSTIATLPSTFEDDLTDVYYFDNRNKKRLIPEHEASLESSAATHAKEYCYDDQAKVVRRKGTDEWAKSNDRVRIYIHEHQLRTLYSNDENETPFMVFRPGVTLPRDNSTLKKAVLMRCSSLAEEHFTFTPKSRLLELPVWYPRKHTNGQEKKKDRGYIDRMDWAMSYLHSDPIEHGIISWLKDMEAWDDENEKAKAKAKKKGHIPKEGGLPKRRDIPRPIIPNTLAEKIHLYNAMLHLGVPKFIQAPLIEALVKEMYQKKLNECELDLLEITIGRFHSHTVAVLDPVLNHLIGNYGSRHKEEDRDNVNPPSEENDGDNDNPPNPQKQLNPLRYGVENAGRLDYLRDTVLIAPKLPVLGHSIKNWSGVRYRDGDARTAHVGYPLNVGTVLKHWRRNETDKILGKRKKALPPLRENAEGNADQPGEDNQMAKRPKTGPLKEGEEYGREGVHYTEYSTYLLKDFREYYTNKPGTAWNPPEGTNISSTEPGEEWGKPEDNATK